MRILMFILGTVALAGAVVGKIFEKADLVTFGAISCIVFWTLASKMPKKSELICINCGKGWKKSQVRVDVDYSDCLTWMCPDCEEIQPLEKPSNT